MDEVDKKYLTVRCKNLMRYDLVYSIPEGGGVVETGTYENEPVMLPGGAQIPTAFFRDPRTKEVLEGDEEGKQKYLGYKSLHYEHMREYIQIQENLGNQVKFALLDSNYAYVY